MELHLAVHSQTLAALVAANAGVQERVDAVAAIINDAIEKIEAGEYNDGVQTFQKKLIDIIKMAKLIHERWMDVL